MLGSQEMDPRLLSGFTKKFVFTKESSVGKHEGKKKIETVSLFVSGILALFGTIIMFLSIIKMIIKKINKHFLCHQWSSVDAKVSYKKSPDRKFEAEVPPARCTSKTLSQIWSWKRLEAVLGVVVTGETLYTPGGQLTLFSGKMKALFFHVS